MRMSHNKTGFKPLLLDSKYIKRGKKKAFLLIVLVNQAVALTLATVRTNNHFFLSGISSHFSLQSHSDCSCYDRVVSPNYFRFNHQLRFFLKVESNAQVSSQIPGTQFQKTCIF